MRWKQFPLSEYHTDKMEATCSIRIPQKWDRSISLHQNNDQMEATSQSEYHKDTYKESNILHQNTTGMRWKQLALSEYHKNQIRATYSIRIPQRWDGSTFLHQSTTKTEATYSIHVRMPLRWDRIRKTDKLICHRNRTDNINYQYKSII